MSDELIVRDAAIRGGRPVLAGTMLRVSDVAAYHVFGGLTADQLASYFELDGARVQAALAYYSRHRDAIDREISANDAEAEVWRRLLMEQGRAVDLS